LERSTQTVACWWGKKSCFPLNTGALFCYSLAEMKFLENPERSLKFHLCKISISDDWTDLTFTSLKTAFCILHNVFVSAYGQFIFFKTLFG
jgi:hypothetical protein